MLPMAVSTISGCAQRLTDSNAWGLSWPGMTVILLAVVTTSTDMLWRKIPNWITYPACLSAFMIGFLVTFVSGPNRWTGAVGLGESLSGFVVCFGCMLFPYRASGGGAGDVKLAAVYGALLGWQMGLSIILWSYISAGLVLILVHLCTSQPWLLPSALVRRLGAAWLPQFVAAPDDLQRQVLSRPIPLAGAFAVGLVCVLLGGNLFGN
jgi:prepilin peptidase CpaA